MLRSVRYTSKKIKLIRPRLDQKDQTVDRSAAAKGREDRNIYSPEFISPQKQPSWSVWKKIVRQDCLRRRLIIEIPEFYVGSIMAVTYADQFAADKTLRFVGRVIWLEGFGTNHKVMLRNKVMDSMVNMKIDLYAPIIQKIEILRLEKWKDSNLRYLRHCDDYYCDIPHDMMQEPPPAVTEEIDYFPGKVGKS